MNIIVDRAVIEQALEALEEAENVLTWDGFQRAADALRVALAEPEQEPVAWMLKSGHGTEFNECIADELKALTWKGKPMWVPLYTAPPKRKPLIEEEIAYAVREIDFPSITAIARAIEVAHGIKEES